MVHMNVEDEAKAKLKITKTDKETGNPIKAVQYKITGAGLKSTGKIVVTNTQGEIYLSGLKINSEYIVEELKANKYYVNDAFTFKVVNEDGEYIIKIKNPEYDSTDEESQEFLTGSVDSLNIKETEITEENYLPTVNLEISDEKIPTYNLQIKKVEKGTDTVLEGAKFELLKSGKRIGTYETNENGLVTIEELNQYKNDHDLDQTYTLREIIAPEGYARATDIEFYAEEVAVQNEETGEEETKLQLIQVEGNTSKYTAEGNTIILTVEDKPVFKLIKKDGETNALLPNTKFAIYNVEDDDMPAKNSKGEYVGTKEIIDGKEYYAVATDENGEIKVDLPQGFYKAVEIEADDKYDISENEKYFGIGTSREGKKQAVVNWANKINSTYVANQWYELHEKDVTKTSDGGYIVGGEFYKKINVTDYGPIYAVAEKAVLLVKYDKNNNLEWTRQIGSSAYNSQGTPIGLIKVVGTNDRGYISAIRLSSSATINLGNNVTIRKKGSSSSPNTIIIKYAANGQIEWYRYIYSSKNSQIQEIIQTQDGGILLSGYFTGNKITIDGGVEINNIDQVNNSYNSIIIKYDLEGNAEWARNILGSQYNDIESIAELPDKGYIIAGHFKMETLDLGNNIVLNNNGNTDGMIIKYDLDGNIEWAKNIGGEGDDTITKMITDTDGNIIIYGLFNDSNLDDDTHITGEDNLIVKYTEDLEVEWYNSVKGQTFNKMIGTSDSGFITIGSIQEEILNGKYIRFGGKGITKYNEYGQIEYVKYLDVEASNSTDITSMVELENSDYIYVTTYTGNVDFENAIRFVGETGLAHYTMVVRISEVKDGKNVVKYAQSIGTNNKNSSFNSVCSCKDGGYYAAGVVGADGIIRKNKSNGEIQWTKYIKDNSGTVLTSVTGTADNGCLVGGYYKGANISIDNKVIATNHQSGSNDGIIVKLSSEGAVEWAISVGGTGVDTVNSITVTSDGGYLVGADFSSSSVSLGN